MRRLNWGFLADSLLIGGGIIQMAIAVFSLFAPMPVWFHDGIAWLWVIWVGIWYWKWITAKNALPWGYFFALVVLTVFGCHCVAVVF